jgi:hypothetical protein
LKGEDISEQTEFYICSGLERGGLGIGLRAFSDFIIFKANDGNTKYLLINFGIFSNPWN